MDKPLLFCVFNRPEVTRRVFEKIRRVQPTTLLVSADGPRADRPADAEQVRQVREIFDDIDWLCDTRLQFHDSNLGCRRAMNAAIDWAFRYHDDLIVLEDDCLPNESFFDFCSAMLDKHRDDHKVMMVSGDNFQPVSRTKNSYFFSKFGHIWGWATWRRAWRNQHDPAMRDWAIHGQTDWLKKHCPDLAEFEFWKSNFDLQAANKIDTWDYAWQYSIWRANALVAMPDRNLVTNIGFGDAATHTLDSTNKLANLPLESLGPVDQWVHPKTVEQNLEADQYAWENVFRSTENFVRRDWEQKSQTIKPPSMWERLNGAWKSSGEAA